MKKEKNIIIGIAIIIGTIGFALAFIHFIKMLFILIPVTLIVCALVFSAKKLENIRIYELRALQRIADELSFFCSSEKELRNSVRIKVPISATAQKNPQKYVIKFKGKKIEHTEEIDYAILELIESIDLEYMEVDLFFERIEEKIKNFFNRLYK